MQTLLPAQKQSTDSLSVYRGELTTQGIIKGVSAIQKSFPSLPIEFYEVLKDRIKASGFSDDRFIDAVNHVIDNCVYPQPTVAQFVSFDKKIKLNTYEEMIKKTNEIGPEIWKSYKQVMLPGRVKPVWVHIDEANQLGL